MTYRRPIADIDLGDDEPPQPWVCPDFVDGLFAELEGSR